VGNLTVGGTGKTPTVRFLAAWLQSRGKSVAILSRGYRRESRDLVIVSDGRAILADCRQGGDEPVMLAKSLPAVPVVVDRDRVRGGRFIEHRFKPDILLLDDGYQHRRLHRDLDIVTFRADKLWGNGFCLPAGPLRERRHHLKRADLIWLNGDTVDSDQQQRLPEGVPRLLSRLQPTALVGHSGEQSLVVLQEQRVAAFCGIAQPDRFRQQLLHLGATIVIFRTFADHHRYAPAELHALQEEAQRTECRWLITTEKDWHKLPPTVVAENWVFLRLTLQPVDAEILSGLLQC